MRNYRMDNIKCFLIFCVVLGHMLELTYAGGGYRIIYSFHMPAFIFISGYYAQFNREKIVSCLIYPYILFQFLYLIFDAVINNQNPAILKFQFTTPYWLLWYLMVLIFYYLLLPFMDGINEIFLLISGCVVSLVIGFDQSIGYYLSLSRFFTFLPYFILGRVWKHLNIDILFRSYIFKFLNVIGVLVTCFFLGKFQYINNAMLYGSYSYVNAGYSILIKGLLLLCASNWILFFMWIFPNFKIPFISSIGKNTFNIFLLHGFIKKYLESHGGVFVYSKNVNIGLAILMSSVIVLVFGNKYIGTLGKLVFTGEGIRKIIKYIKVKTN